MASVWLEDEPMPVSLEELDCSGALLDDSGCIAFIFAMLDAFLLRILLSWLFGGIIFRGSPEQELYGYILGYGLASYGMALPGLFYYLFCPWQKRKLVTD